MSNRKLSLLGLLAAAVVALAVIVAGIADKPYAKKDQVAYLVQGLDPDLIAKITIGKPGQEVTLNRRGTKFVVANLNNYPALTSEINRLITTCLDIQTSSLYTENPDNHKDLKVAEPNVHLLVKFYKTDSSLLTGVIIGREKVKGQGIAFVRRVDDNKVYVTAGQIPAIKNQPMDYVEQGLVNIRRGDINSVSVSSPDGTYVLLPGLDDKTVIFENLSLGKVLDNTVANRVFTALADVSFEDVNAESSRRDLVFDRRFICRLKDSTVYTIWLAKEGDNWYAKCDAQFADKTPVTKTEGEVESDEQLKIKEAKLIARDAAEEFSDNHKGWVYKFPAYRAVYLTKSADELLSAPKPILTEVNELNEMATPEKE